MLFQLDCFHFLFTILSKALAYWNKTEVRWTNSKWTTYFQHNRTSFINFLVKSSYVSLPTKHIHFTKLKNVLFAFHDLELHEPTPCIPWTLKDYFLSLVCWTDIVSAFVGELFVMFCQERCYIVHSRVCKIRGIMHCCSGNRYIWRN